MSSAMAASQALLLCYNRSFLPTKPLIVHRLRNPRTHLSHSYAKPLSSKSFETMKSNLDFRFSDKLTCRATPQKPSATMEELDDNLRRVIQALLWVAEGVYILWLFLLPFAPGDPVWAISSDTVNSLMSEGLFNFVIGWTVMFAPLLFTDRMRDRYKGSLDVLWGLQMFLTNTFLIPYMAIRLNEADSDYIPSKRSQLGLVMTRGASIVGLSGGIVCLVSVTWGLFGRMDGNFGGIAERWEFLVSYLGSERLAYAFIWDICFYIVFQPWLIGDNLQNVEQRKVGIVKYLRFVPVIGLISYLVCLNLDDEL